MIDTDKLRQIATKYNLWSDERQELYKAIETIEQTNIEWIPCSDRLPNEEECNLYEATHPCHRQFICTVKIGEYEPQTRQLFFSKIAGWKYGPEDYNKYVTHWQPLPEPYKEVSE